MRRVCGWLLCLVLAVPGQVMAQEVPSLSVLADSSVAVPLSRAVRAYAAQQQVAVSLAFADLVDLEHQAVEGAVYDVLVTASPSLLASLKQRGLVDLHSEAPVATGRLVLVTGVQNATPMSLGARFPSSAMIAALTWEPGLLLGNPETLTQGTFAREALKSYGVMDDMEPYIVYEKSLTDLLDTVAAQGSYGIVYAADAVFDRRLRTIGDIPASHHRPIEYKAVALAGEKMTIARQFIGYLRQADARATLQGF